LREEIFVLPFDYRTQFIAALFHQLLELPCGYFGIPGRGLVAEVIVVQFLVCRIGVNGFAEAAFIPGQGLLRREGSVTDLRLALLQLPYGFPFLVGEPDFIYLVIMGVFAVGAAACAQASVKQPSEPRAGAPALCVACQHFCGVVLPAQVNQTV
jgi:hypothetical protein